MRKLLILFLLFQSSVLFSQTETYQDLVNHTSVTYTKIEEEVNNANLDLLEEANYIQLKEDQWPGAKKINALIHNQLNELKTPEFARRFEQEYAKALKSTLIDWYNSWVEESKGSTKYDHYSDFANNFTPDQLYAEFFITTLCGHILIGGMNVSFIAARDQDQLSVKDLAFQDLHYYDLIKGVEIDPSTILDRKKLREFHKLIKNHVPEHLKGMADTLDLTKGLPLFNGASFYYFIEGNIEADTDKQAILQIRLSFEEVLPYLNPDGPFKAYLAIKPTNSKFSELMYDEYNNYNFHCLHAVESLSSIERLMENLSGDAYANKTAHIIQEHWPDVETQISFNKAGQVLNRKVTVPKEQISDDSLAYSYHPNGNLKTLDFYELKNVTDESGERDELKLVKACLFDEHQNLLKRSTYSYYLYHGTDIESSTAYFSYFNDRVVMDVGSETNCASGYEWGATEYGIYQGSAFFLQNNDDIPDKRSYSYRYSGDSIFIDLIAYNKTVSDLFYRTEKDKIVEFTENQGHYQAKITYDSFQRPIQFSTFKKTNTGFVPYTAASIEYDSKNRPVKYTFQMLDGDQKLNTPKVYLFRYE